MTKRLKVLEAKSARLAYYAFPEEHWRRIPNPLERARSGGAPASGARCLPGNRRSPSPPRGCATSPARRGLHRHGFYIAEARRAARIGSHLESGNSSKRSFFSTDRRVLRVPVSVRGNSLKTLTRTRSKN